MPNYKYLHIQEKDRSWGVVVTTVGQQEIAAGEAYPAAGHPRRYLFSSESGRILQEYHLVYISKGEGWFESAHCSKVHVQAGDVLVLFPGEWHNYAPDSRTGWTESWIGFNGYYVERLFREGFFSEASPVVRIGLLDAVYAYFTAACALAKEELSASQQALGGLACAILGALYYYGKEYSLRTYDHETVGKIEAAKQYMRDHVQASFPMEAVAEHVGLGYSKFRKLFKQYTGISPAQYCQGVKLSLAKNLLTNSNSTCQEIAFSLGFESASYFNVLFSKHERMTPLSYREITRQGKR